MSTSPTKGMRVAAGIVCAVVARSCSSTCSGPCASPGGLEELFTGEQTDPAS
jgi:hypothetical protein